MYFLVCISLLHSFCFIGMHDRMRPDFSAIRFTSSSSPLRICMNSNAQMRADLTLLAVTLLAAAGWIFSKEALQGFAPLTFVAMRFVTAGLVLALLGRAALLAMSRDEWIRSLRVGLFFGLAMAFWILGLQHASHLGVGAFLTSLGVVLVPVVGILFGEKPPSSARFSLPLAASGLACLSLDGEFHLGWGELAFLLAALLFALTFVLTSRAAARIHAVALTSIQLVMAGLVALPLALLFESWSGSPSAVYWGWLLASILVATSLRFLLQTWAQGQTSASSAAVIMVLEPVWTAILAILWFAESLSLVQALGCGLIFSALLASRWGAVRAMLVKRSSSSY
jgi:drug/metabolite transporter (DMT)-like permease